MKRRYKRIAEEATNGSYITVYIKPNSREEKLTIENEELIFYTTEPPIKGRANAALVRELSRNFKISSSKIQIVYGYHKRTKKIFIEGISVDKIIKTLENL